MPAVDAGRQGRRRLALISCGNAPLIVILVPLTGDYSSVVIVIPRRRATLWRERPSLSFATPPRNSGGRSCPDATELITAISLFLDSFSSVSVSARIFSKRSPCTFLGGGEMFRWPLLVRRAESVHPVRSPSMRPSAGSGSTRSLLRKLSVALVVVVAALGSACGTDDRERPVQTQHPTTPASSAPESPTTAPSNPTEKNMVPSSPNSFSPTLKAPTPYSPRPCLPFCD